MSEMGLNGQQQKNRRMAEWLIEKAQDSYHIKTTTIEWKEFHHQALFVFSQID